MNLFSFQKPSRYINKEVNALHKDAPVKVALAFPDIYEIGMSHLGLRILYKIINDLPFASAERVFAPWIDLEAEMRAYGIPLSSLESNRPLKDFDIVGFSLQYELSYTTVLNMLNLGGIPLRPEDRNDSFVNYAYPLIIAGGPCCVNPAPMSSFIDAFLVGDGEEAIKDILDTYYIWQTTGDRDKVSLLRSISQIEGMYVPSMHRFSSFTSNPPSCIKRRRIESLDNVPYPDSPIIPYTQIIHDRINVEVSRGCSMGCRFCQAGMIYRPVRERSQEKVVEIAESSLKNTGYEEVAFTSLSAGDYAPLLCVIKELNNRFTRNKVAVSLPSLRVASINHPLLKEIRTVRKTGFTLAPEAGTDRLRRVINKDFQQKEYEEALEILFEEGWHNLKLYFMIGLPTETEEDIEAIPQMALKALRTAKQYTKRFVNISIGISPFVPKPHTPFQWYGQNSFDELKRKKAQLRNILIKKGFKVKGHSVEMSVLEAAFARGDERTALLLEKAWSLGCRLDGWSEVFDFEKWKAAMDITGININQSATKTFQYADILPWERIDIGVSKEFLWREYENALAERVTVDCQKVCHNCGIGCHKDTMNQRYKETTSSNTNDDITRFIVSPIHISTYTSQFKPVRLRVEFSKTGILRCLSHLELMTVILRALRRAEYPLEYSKGYHPSPRISFGPPLSVGISGLSEYFDLEIIPPFDLVSGRKKLNMVLPEGIYIKDLSVIPRKTASLSRFITRYEYEIRGGDRSSAHMFLAEEVIEKERRKRIINLKDMVEDVSFINEDSIKLVVVDQDDIKVRLGELLPVLLGVPMEKLDITRLALYGWDGGWMRPLDTLLTEVVDYK